MDKGKFKRTEIDVEFRYSSLSRFQFISVCALRYYIVISKPTLVISTNRMMKAWKKIHIQVEDIQFISALDIPVRSVTLIKSEDM